MQNYKSVKTIGKGSFGYAVLVRHKQQPDNFYVMKMIDIKKMSQKQREEASNEITILKSLNNPFIIKYRESFEEKNVLCIVMDFANGGDLYNMINYYKNKNMYIPENIIVQIFTEICIALNHVHSNKILHRDLKTQNIFLTKERHVKLGDFGISRVLQHTYDKARTAIGTPYYLSPEICEEKPYNHKSDVWSIGCILYEMMSRTHAFDALSMKVLVIKILNGKYPPPPQHYSENLKILLKSLLQRDPNKRPCIEQILHFPGIYEQVKILEQEYNLKFIKEQEEKKSLQHIQIKEKVILQYKSPKRSKSFIDQKVQEKNKEIKSMRSELNLKKRTKSLLYNTKNKKNSRKYSQRENQQILVKKSSEKLNTKIQEQKDQYQQYYSEQQKIKNELSSNQFDNNIDKNFSDQKNQNQFQQKFQEIQHNVQNVASFQNVQDQSKSKKLNPIINQEQQEDNIFNNIDEKRKKRRNKSNIWQKRNLTKSLEKNSQLIQKKQVERDRPKTPGQNIKSIKNKSKKILFEFLSKEQQKKNQDKNLQKEEKPEKILIQQQNIEKPRLRTNFFDKEQESKTNKVQYQSIQQQKVKQDQQKYQSNQQKIPLSKENQEINQILEKYWKNQIFEQSLKQNKSEKIEDKIIINTNQILKNLPIEYEENDSLSFKIELLIQYLEKQIGLQKFLTLYKKLVDDFTLDEDLPLEDQEYVPLITQLIYLEEKVYCNQFNFFINDLYLIQQLQFQMNFKVEAIYFAEFDIHAGPLLKFIATDQKLMEENIKKHFESWKDFLTPDEQLCGKFVRIFMDQDYSVLSQAIQKQSDKYERKKIIFTVAFVVHNKIFECYKDSFQSNINKLYNYLMSLEQNDFYVSQNNYKIMDEIIQVIFKQLKTDDKLILVNNNQICYLLFRKKNHKELNNINQKLILGRQFHKIKQRVN